MPIPPGIRWVISSLPTVCVPLLGLYFLDRFLLRQFLEFNPPTWMTVALYLLWIPIFFTVKLLLSDFRVYTKAKYLGAIFPPTIQSKLPGGLDLTMALGKASQDAYPCSYTTHHILVIAKLRLVDGLARSTKKYGNTFNWRLMFVNRVGHAFCSLGTVTEKCFRS